MWCKQHWGALFSKGSTKLLVRQGSLKSCPSSPNMMLLQLMTTLSPYMRFWGASWPMETFQLCDNCLECNMNWNMTLSWLQEVVSTCRADQWPVAPEEGGRESLGCEAATHSEEKTLWCFWGQKKLPFLNLQLKLLTLLLLLWPRKPHQMICRPPETMLIMCKWSSWAQLSTKTQLVIQILGVSCYSLQDEAIALMVMKLKL